MESKKWWESRLIWSGAVLVLSALVEVATLLAGWAERGASIGELATVIVPGVIGIVVIYLRKRTTSVIG